MDPNFLKDQILVLDMFSLQDFASILKDLYILAFMDANTQDRALVLEL